MVLKTNITNVYITPTSTFIIQYDLRNLPDFNGLYSFSDNIQLEEKPYYYMTTPYYYMTTPYYYHTTPYYYWTTTLYYTWWRYLTTLPIRHCRLFPCFFVDNLQARFDFGGIFDLIHLRRL